MGKIYSYYNPFRTDLKTEKLTTEFEQLADLPGKTNWVIFLVMVNAIWHEWLSCAISISKWLYNKNQPDKLNLLPYSEHKHEPFQL